MSRYFGYIVLVLSLFIYGVSCNQNLTKKLDTYKTTTIPAFQSDRWKNGDLYGMSYLPYFRKHSATKERVRPIVCGSEHNIDLYAICDSYLWGFFASNKFYCDVNKLILVTTNNGQKLKVRLDSSKINVLLLEFSERNLRSGLGDDSYVDSLVTVQNKGLTTSSNNTEPSEPNNSADNSMQQNISWKARAIAVLHGMKKMESNVFAFIFNNKINSNIESNFWDISLFTPIKELKSNLNYRLFNKVDNNVKISKDGRQLFYTPTIDTSDVMSSFKYFPEAEKDTLVGRLNRIYTKAKQVGFTKVYLSIIPNPVSILDPHYNGLVYNDVVNRIQDYANLKMPFIDIVPVFKVLKSKAYLPSDTHWSQYGADTWLNKFNNELEKIATENMGLTKK